MQSNNEFRYSYLIIPTLFDAGESCVLVLVFYEAALTISYAFFVRKHLGDINPISKVFFIDFNSEIMEDGKQFMIIEIYN